MGTKGRKIAALLSLIVMAVIAITAWRGWPHIRFWWLFEPLGKNAQEYPEFRHRQTGIVFVKLPGGTFQMGSPDDERWRNKNEGPVHDVTLSPFMIAKFEVTQLQWEKVMGEGNNPSHFKGSDQPVVKVSWGSLHAGDGFLERTGLLLPTEAQWEYSCRAGTSTRFYSGDGDEDLARMAWYDGNSGGKLHSVGEKPANAFGLHDMHGNVREWCLDMWDQEFYKKPESRQKNPMCKSGSIFPVMRGGSWNDFARFCRSAFRDGFHTDFSNGDLGFRPCYRLSQ